MIVHFYLMFDKNAPSSDNQTALCETTNVTCPSPQPIPDLKNKIYKKIQQDFGKDGYCFVPLF